MHAAVIGVLAAALSGSPGPYAIAGTVRHAVTGERLDDTLVVLKCACLPAALETATGEDGTYRFVGLPAGRYTVVVLRGNGERSRVVDVGPR